MQRAFHMELGVQRLINSRRRRVLLGSSWLLASEGDGPQSCAVSTEPFPHGVYPAARGHPGT